MADDDVWFGTGWLVRRAGEEGVALHVGHVPGRKQVAIYTVTPHPWVADDGTRCIGAVRDVHAYCRSERDAQALIAALDVLIKPIDPGDAAPPTPPRRRTAGSPAAVGLPANQEEE